LDIIYLLYPITQGETQMKTNYVILYSGGSMPESESEQKAVMQAWEDWYSRIGNALVDAGNPFGPRAKSITSDGMIKDDSDGCMPSGYSIIQADSIDSAVMLAQTCPILRDGAKVSVYETFNAMPM
jgi:hypothetical protein